MCSLTHVTNEPVYETGARTDRLAIDGGWGGEGELEAGERRRPRCCMLVGRANTLHGGAQGLDSISWSKPRWERTNKSKTISPQRGPARGRSCFLFFPPFAGGPDPERSMHSLQNLSYPSNYLLFSVVYTGYSTWGAIFVSIQIPLTAYHFLAITTRNVLWQLLPQILGVAW